MLKGVGERMSGMVKRSDFAEDVNELELKREERAFFASQHEGVEYDQVLSAAQARDSEEQQHLRPGSLPTGPVDSSRLRRVRAGAAHETEVLREVSMILDPDKRFGETIIFAMDWLHVMFERVARFVPDDNQESELLTQQIDSYRSEIIGADLAEHLVNKTLTFLTDEKAINDRIFAAEQRDPIDAFHQWVDAHFVTDQLLHIFRHFKTSPQRLIEYDGFIIVLSTYMGRHYSKSDFVLQMIAMVDWRIQARNDGPPDLQKRMTVLEGVVCIINTLYLVLDVH